MRRIVIDTSIFLYKFTHALCNLCNSKKEPTGVFYGFLNLLTGFKQDFNDVVLVFDSPIAKHSYYKANRSSQDKEKVYAGRDKLIELVLSLGCGVVKEEGMESDFLIASCLGDERTWIYTTDQDLLQLVSDNVTVVASKDEEWTVAKVTEKFGVPPSKVPLLRSFVGDRSDNIPGIPRVNKKVLADAVNSNDDIAVILPIVTKNLKLSEQNFAQYDTLIRENYRLTRIVPPFPTVTIKRAKYDEQAVRNFLSWMESQRFVARYDLIEGFCRRISGLVI